MRAQPKQAVKVVPHEFVLCKAHHQEENQRMRYTVYSCNRFHINAKRCVPPLEASPGSVYYTSKCWKGRKEVAPSGLFSRRECLWIAWTVRLARLHRESKALSSRRARTIMIPTMSTHYGHQIRAKAGFEDWRIRGGRGRGRGVGNLGFS